MDGPSRRRGTVDLTTESKQWRSRSTLTVTTESTSSLDTHWWHSHTPSLLCLLAVFSVPQQNGGDWIIDPCSDTVSVDASSLEGHVWLKATLRPESLEHWQQNLKKKTKKTRQCTTFLWCNYRMDISLKSTGRLYSYIIGPILDGTSCYLW